MEDTTHPNYPYPSRATLERDHRISELLLNHRIATAAYHKVATAFLAALARIESPLGSVSAQHDMEEIYEFIQETTLPRAESSLALAALDAATAEVS